MKKLLFIVFVTIITGTVSGQPSQGLKNGGYSSLDEFKNQSPKYEDLFLISKRSTADIKAWGGNDYRVESINDTIAKNVIKKEIWGICKNDTLYLNGAA
jgi:hypothetical protein